MPNPWPICRRFKIGATKRPPAPPATGKKAAGHPLQLIFSGLLPARTGLFLLGLLLLCILASRCQAGEDAYDPVLPYIQNGGYAVITAAGHLEGLHTDTPFTPASTLKLVTCLGALQILGPDHRFTTRLYYDPAGILGIKAGGEPMLTSEEVAQIAKDLYALGIRRVTAIVIDDSAFALESSVDGSEHSARPYDAEIGPLAVNFNALPVLVRGDRSIGSGERQTPVLPMMRELGATLAPGRYRLNVGAFPARPGLPNEARYAGELFQALLRQQGIRTGETISRGRVPENARLILTHQSAPLQEIIRNCLEYSNNFIANQLYVACGSKHLGEPATWEKARLVFAEFTHRTLHLAPASITMVEGSGLSRHNRLTPRAMITILEAFAPFSGLLPAKDEILLKSGTMTGVYCYGGYFEDHGSRTPFSIMLNQEINSRNQILAILAARFQPAPDQDARTR